MVWGHPARVQRIRNELASIGQAGLPQLFGDQVRRHFDAGRRVFIIGPPGDTVLGWAQTNTAWTTRQLYAEDPARPGRNPEQPPLVLWEVSRAPAQASPEAPAP
jgi:hypothetical protein